MKIQLVYKTCNGDFEIGDVVRIITEDPFSKYNEEFEGKILNSMLTSEIRVDCSDKYKSCIKDLRIDEIVKIEKL